MMRLGDCFNLAGDGAGCWFFLSCNSETVSYAEMKARTELPSHHSESEPWGPRLNQLWEKKISH